MKSCTICDDPRQYVPPNGQTWTTLREMLGSKKYRNVFKQDKYHSGAVSIFTEPQFGIGQRAILCCTEKGNVLWDCITFIDAATVKHITDLGGVEAIVISHPHYYSTALHWAEIFGCKVYMSSEDKEWVMREGPALEFWDTQELELLEGEFKAVKVGGHFPGSSVMLWKSAKKLLVADSITVVPSGVYHVDRPVDTASFTFMWSYPNMVRLLLYYQI
jgi:glyoxylase-like metal-dependent hydrolase (beta-lactamase superfamily II)